MRFSIKTPVEPGILKIPRSPPLQKGGEGGIFR